MTLTIAELRAEHFKPLVDQAFTLELAPDDVAEAVLVEVWESPRTRPGAARTTFALTFQTTRGPRPQQGTYALGHPAIGRLELFMTAIAPTPIGQRYEVVIA